MLRAAFLADKELRDHYREWRSSYLFWAAQICIFTYPLPGGGVLEFDELETVVRLAAAIEKGDGDLSEHMHLPGTRKLIFIDYLMICKLFALNIVAKEPVRV